MVACNSHQTTPRSRARDQLSQYFIGLCLKFEILSREPPQQAIGRVRDPDGAFDAARAEEAALGCLGVLHGEVRRTPEHRTLHHPIDDRN